MKVIAFINGSLISETTAIYALKYAKQINAALTLIHIEGSDSLEDVSLSVENLELLADELKVQQEYVSFASMHELKEFVTSHVVDMLFCSTRHNRGILDRSFIDALVAQHFKIDLAVLKIVKMANAKTLDSIIMPIRASRLSVKKFTLFSMLSLAYSAKVEIYSIDKQSRSFFSSSKKVHQHFQELLFALRHYIKLLRASHIQFTIKYDLCHFEGDEVKSHIAQGNYDLAIIGAHTSGTMFRNHPIDTLFKNPLINTLYFLPAKE